MEFDQFDGPFRDPLTGERLANAWGYNTVAFFAPESHYSYYGKLGEQVDEFKMLVRELHKHDIEVILDVVFNHTREGNHYGPTISFKGLDNNIYYMLTPEARSSTTTSPAAATRSTATTRWSAGSSSTACATGSRRCTSTASGSTWRRSSPSTSTSRRRARRRSSTRSRPTRSSRGSS